MTVRPQTASPPADQVQARPAARPDATRRIRSRPQAAALRVGLVGECPLIVTGLSALLRKDDPGARVETGRPGTAGRAAVALTLVDPVLRTSVTTPSLTSLLADPARGRIVAFSFDPPADLVREWLSAGCVAVVDKRTASAGLARVLTELAAGPVAGVSTPPPPTATASQPGGWPLQEHGLTRREAEMVLLITRGLMNRDICAQTGLSNNTVKSYIRAAYGKIGLTRRSEAVRWGVQHGMLDPTARYVASAPPVPVSTVLAD